MSRVYDRTKDGGPKPYDGPEPFTGRTIGDGLAEGLAQFGYAVARPAVLLVLVLTFHSCQSWVRAEPVCGEAGVKSMTFLGVVCKDAK